MIDEKRDNDMINTYTSYLQMKGSLFMPEMLKIHNNIISSIEHDEDGIEFYNELLQVSIKYSNYRCIWFTLSREEKINIDDSRTSSHNMVIVKLNQLTRYLASVEKDTTWREIFEDEEKPENRKKIGDFACYLAFINALNAR